MLNYWHWAGVSPYTSAFALAGTCVFDKQLLSVINCNLKSCDLRQDISLTYVQLLLPSSLRIVIPIAFVYSTRPPVSVLVRLKLPPFTNLFLKTENSLLTSHNSLFKTFSELISEKLRISDLQKSKNQII